MPNLRNLPWWYLAILLLANLTLLTPQANPVRIVGALLLIGLLPGLSWANYFWFDSLPLLRFTLAAALSYAFTLLTTLLLHYLPGPVLTWQLLLVLNILAVLPITVLNDRKPKDKCQKKSFSTPGTIPVPLLLILLTALFLRVTNLHYSEFQGDEALVMISAAESLEGHEDALFLRSKGPAEVLLPMALWRLTGTISEPIARLPFTVAAMFAIVTIYLIGQAIAGERVGWIAAGFFAFSGFMVAFGRIVQYQTLVVWMSALAFLLVIKWRATRRIGYVVVGGLLVGAGLLAHYDAILVLPAIFWLLIATNDERWTTAESYGGFWAVTNSQIFGRLKAALLFLATFLLTALAFYLPYILDPQANRTGEYVGGRIGNELRNNLPDFFRFNTFYSSFYYIAITGLLVLAFCLWVLWQSGALGRIVGVITTLGLFIVIFIPNLLRVWSFLPFAALFLTIFLALFSQRFIYHNKAIHPGSPASLQALIIWLAVPFLGYNFIVALGLTHIYTIVPAWSLLAAVGFQLPVTNYQLPITNLLLAALLLLSAIFLWNAFVRHDVEYRQDYPSGNWVLFWTPYQEPPQAGFFGFAHRAGWKTVGQKIADGTLTGDYASNEEPDITTWYTRGAPRACDPQPEFYFLADDVIDPIKVPKEAINSIYQEIGNITLPNQKQMQIMQQTPATLYLEDLSDSALARAFDLSATPTAFARSARGSLPVDANFGNLLQLIGYDLDARRAYPGGRVPVTLYWQALAPIPVSYQVFTHLEDDSGPVAQADGVPVCWTYPTDVWRPGQIIADQHAILISPDTPPGQYLLEIGLYLPDTFERLDVLDEAGNPAGTSVTLDLVKIREAGD